MTTTVLVPIYGVERYIAECAESLFSQTYPHLEYVFVDDCTPDNSIAILQSVIENHPGRKDHVRIIRHENNKGIGAVRKTAIESVNTEYFTFVDSDDILPNDAIETLVKRIKETGADIVEGAFQEYNAGVLKNTSLPYHGSQKSYRNKLLCQNMVATNLWAKIYRTEAVRRLKDIFEEGIDYAEDYSANARLAMTTSRAWTDKIVYHYRTDNSSSYTKKMSEKTVISCLRATRRVLAFCLLRGHLPMEAEIGALNMYRLCHNNGITAKQADEILHYVPEHIRAVILYRLLHSHGALYKSGEILYRITRLFYR